MAMNPHPFVPGCTCKACTNHERMLRGMQNVANTREVNYEQLAQAFQKQTYYSYPPIVPSTAVPPGTGIFINARPTVFPTPTMEERKKPTKQVLVPCYAVLGDDAIFRLRIHPMFKTMVEEITTALVGERIAVDIEFDPAVDVDAMIVGKQEVAS